MNMELTQKRKNAKKEKQNILWRVKLTLQEIKSVRMIRSSPRMLMKKD